MKKSVQLREQRASLIKEARAIVDKAKAENRDCTAEENAEFDKRFDAADALNPQIEALEKEEQTAAVRAQRLQEAEAGLQQASNRGISPGSVAGSAAAAGPTDRQQAATDEDRAMALQGWFLNNSTRGRATDRHREAAARCGMDIEAKELELGLNHAYDRVKADVKNALKSNVPASGGVLRLGELMGDLETAMLAFGPMLEVSQVIRTPSANPMPWPTANDTSNTGRQIGESKAVTSVDPTFAALVWNAYKFTSDEILVPFELLRDTPYNLVSIIGAMLGERLGRVQNTKATTGTGAATMYGAVNRATLGKTAAGAAAITADELIDLQDSVPRAYRPGSSFMMKDSTRTAIRKLKDGQSRYLLEPSLTAGTPDKLLGWDLNVNDDMAAMTTGQKSVLAGNFRSYKIRQVDKVRVYRLTERYRENDQDAFLAFVEADGNLLDPGTGVIRYLVQA